MLMTAFFKKSVRNRHYTHNGSTTPKAEREIPSLFAELPGRGVLGSRLARSSDGLGNTSGLEMGQITQGKNDSFGSCSGPLPPATFITVN